MPEPVVSSQAAVPKEFASESSEPNSLREVLLFCVVLVVEVYSLAVAFGGPFFEVGYFLGVVISQTVAGAYIWAQLRRTDRTLPLPELLAMGFAIGSASAAISQLIIRDLLGIRLFLSPLVPIISVAIWLTIRRTTQLSVRITHANTSTLLWLLFPAPLAISFFVWELYAFFVIPLFIFVLLLHKQIDKSIYFLIILITITLIFFSYIYKNFHYLTPVFSIIGPDEIYDAGHAIGFSNWGINSNIFQTDNIFSYYKLLYLWMGPLIELSGSSALIISSTVVVVVILTSVGLSLWSISFQVGGSKQAANIASVLIFLQHSLVEPWNVPIRPAQSLVLCFFIGSLIALSKKWFRKSTFSIVTAVSLFVTFSTRAQYGLILLGGIVAFHLFSLLRKETTFINTFVFAIPSIISLIGCYLIFYTTPMLDYGDRVHDTLLATLASGLGLRIFVPKLLARKPLFSKKYYLLNFFAIFSLLLMFVIDHQLLGDSAFFTVLILFTISISLDSISVGKLLTFRQLIVITIFGIFVGIFTRLLYDIHKWRDPVIFTGLRRLIHSISVQKDLGVIFSIVPFIGIVLTIIVFLKLNRNLAILRPILFTGVLAISLGVSIATTLRQVTNHFVYEFALTTQVEDPENLLLSINIDEESMIDWFRDNTKRDDIFAVNTELPDYATSAKPKSFPLSVQIHRQAYIEAPHLALGLRSNYPRSPDERSTQISIILKRLDVSYNFPINPSDTLLKYLREAQVKWFVVDLGNTQLRDWEPWATTRFMNEKVAILELNHPSDGD